MNGRHHALHNREPTIGLLYGRSAERTERVPCTATGCGGFGAVRLWWDGMQTRWRVGHHEYGCGCEQDETALDEWAFNFRVAS